MLSLLKKIFGISIGQTQQEQRQHPLRLERIIIPSAIWHQLISMLEPYGQQRYEGAALLYGFISKSNEGIVTTAVCPKQYNTSRTYEIPFESMSSVAESVIIPYRALLLAQVHLHPGDFTDLSPKDMKKALNRSIPGGIQIIMPHYGNIQPEQNFVVHENCGNGAWRKWAASERDSRILIMPYAVDLRSFERVV